MSQRLPGASRVCSILILGASAGWMGSGGCNDEPPPDTPGAAASSGTGNAGGAGSAGGTTTSGGGGSVSSFSSPGSDFVSSGAVITNGKYRLVFTIGQSTQNQGTMTNSRYRLQGGVIGVNESSP